MTTSVPKYVSKTEVPLLPLKPILRDAFDATSKEAAIHCDDPTLAQQQFKDDADINVLLERFKVTGVMPVGVVMPEYGDYTGITDYQSAANVMLRASDEFMKLPATVRSRFENNPQRFLEFCADKANLPELRKMGLAPQEAAPPEPMAVRVVDDEPKA
ncbi:MAG: internal scaffolding protein [Arizlama microvirus]|nr:MAG: internal scaffolding protein [Arizlama microvirus]